MGACEEQGKQGRKRRRSDLEAQRRGKSFQRKALGRAGGRAGGRVRVSVAYVGSRKEDSRARRFSNPR